MHNQLKQRIKNRARRNRVEDGKTFCGHNGGNVVDCLPGECYRLENLCRHKLKGLAVKHHDLLQSLHDHVEQQSNSTGLPARDIAIRQYGDIVGILVGMVGEKGQSHA